MERIFLTEKQFRTIEHTLERAAGQRYCGRNEAINELEKMGLMRCVGKASWCPDEYFKVTEKGREVFNQNSAGSEDYNLK